MTDKAYKMLIELLELECDKYNKVKHENRKDYQHDYYLRVTKAKRKNKNRIIE